MIFDTIWNTLIKVMQTILPVSPFRDFVAEIGELPYLSWLNWFFPIGDCIRVLAAWLLAVGAFYGYSIIMRWLKVIGD